jgi:O-antigen/teichoic acid export membrane protein
MWRAPPRMLQVWNPRPLRGNPSLGAARIGCRCRDKSVPALDIMQVRLTEWIRSKIARDLGWSIAGTVLPLAVAVFAIPLLISGIGLQKFGVLTLAWVVVGYFSLFDLGLGRAMTLLISQKQAAGQHHEIPSVVWLGMGLMTALGVVGGLLFGLLAPWIVEQKLAVPSEFYPELRSTIVLLALSIPIVIVSTGLRGILEAKRRFDIINLVRIPQGVMTYLGPVAVLPFSNQLPHLVASLVVVRAVSLVAFIVICLRTYPELSGPAPYSRLLLRQMLSFGGWITVSNMVGPLIVYLGRLVLAAMVSSEAVAYFSVPQDMLTNLITVPTLIIGVFFPRFAQDFARDLTAVRRSYMHALILNLMALIPAVIVICLLARPGLAFWITPDFADASYRVVQILAVAMLINSIGYISQAVVQAHGRADLTAKLLVIELVAYIPYLWMLISAWGIEGAAVAWLLRVTISTVALYVMAEWCLFRPTTIERNSSYDGAPN